VEVYATDFYDVAHLCGVTQLQLNVFICCAKSELLKLVVVEFNLGESEVYATAT
jgi:hypothetical protein